MDRRWFGMMAMAMGIRYQCTYQSSIAFSYSANFMCAAALFQDGNHVSVMDKSDGDGGGDGQY